MSQTEDKIGIRSLIPEDGIFWTSNAQTIALLLLALLVILVVALGIWSSSAKYSLFSLKGGLEITNLFLEIRYKDPDNTKDREHDGYLRSLDLTEASLVVGEKHRRGDSLRLYLDTLPDFPERTSYIDGIVVSAKSLGGEPENFLVRLKFKNIEQETKLPLELYITRLLKDRSAYSHA